MLNQLAAEAQERRAGSEEIQQLLDAHRYREALDRLKGELSRHPDSTLLYRMLAETYEGLGDSTSADPVPQGGPGRLNSANPARRPMGRPARFESDHSLR